MKRSIGRSLVIGALVLMVGFLAPAVEASPGKGEGARGFMDAYVAAFNSGDVEKMLAFYAERGTGPFKKRRTEERDRMMYERLREDLGDLSMEKMLLEPGEAVMVAAGAACDCKATFRFQIEEGEPDGPLRLAGLRVERGDTAQGSGGLPPFDAAGASGSKELEDRLDKYLSGLAEKDLFSGTVLVARKGKPLFQGAYGMANRETKVPNRMGTRFDLGSITKTFTKTAIARLAQEGKLKLTDTIGDWIPDYPNREAARKVRIEHLSRHTSGLGDIFNEKWPSVPKETLLAPRDFFPIFASEDLLFEPGEGERYSNAGYIVLGAIVEAASGMPYDQYIRKTVFDPAGMTGSGFLARDGSREDVAVGYTTHGPGGHHGERTELHSNIGSLPVKGCPAGSSSSPAMDLVRFDRALREGKLLDPAWTEWFFMDGMPDVPADMRSEDTSSFELPIGIAGGAPGVNAYMESGDGMAVVVLANLDPPVAMELGRKIRSIPWFRPE